MNFNARPASLTAEQVLIGRRMRDQERKSWYRIALELGCADDTIRRALDPNFAEQKRAREAKRKLRRVEHRHLSVKERCAAFKPKHAHRRREDESFSDKPAPDETFARRRSTEQDDAFVDAMTKAVRAERERCPIGIEMRPGTDRPHIVESRQIPRSVTGSSAQMCADFA